MGRRRPRLLMLAGVAVASCGSGDAEITDAPPPQPVLTPGQASAVNEAILTVGRNDTMWCLTARSEALDLHVSDMCLDVPFAMTELMLGRPVPRGLFDERYSTVSLWIMPLAEAVVDVEAQEGQVDPIFRGDSGALMLISEAVGNVDPMTVVVVYGDATLRCRLTHGSNNCLRE